MACRERMLHDLLNQKNENNGKNLVEVKSTIGDIQDDFKISPNASQQETNNIAKRLDDCSRTTIIIDVSNLSSWAVICRVMAIMRLGNLIIGSHPDATDNVFVIGLGSNIHYIAEKLVGIYKNFLIFQ